MALEVTCAVSRTPQNSMSDSMAIARHRDRSAARRGAWFARIRTNGKEDIFRAFLAGQSRVAASAFDDSFCLQLVRGTDNFRLISPHHACSDDLNFRI